MKKEEKKRIKKKEKSCFILCCIGAHVRLSPSRETKVKKKNYLKKRYDEEYVDLFLGITIYGSLLVQSTIWEKVIFFY